jgi:2-hydroxy-3-keto-5-methylthiopentenyl-1-phosphate phosphatase
LLNLKRQLLEKYPERRERIVYIVDVLASKLSNLRIYTLADYLHTVWLAVKEFGEFEEMVPSEKEVEELLKEGEWGGEE